MSNANFNQVLREMGRTFEVYDPLIICLNRHMFFNTEGRGITCNKLKVELGEYDTNYFKEKIFKPANNRYKYLVETVKYTRVRFL